jgi:flagellar FliL protein
MILSHKSSRDLLDRAGKEQLAAEILRDASRTMGIETREPEPVSTKAEDADKPAADAGADDEDPKPKAKPKPKPAKAEVEPSPIRHVHFSNFIVQ